MNKSVTFAAAFSLLLAGIASAFAADKIVTSTLRCKDGTEVYMESACTHRGGVVKTIKPSEPVKTPIPINAMAKTNKTRVASTKPQKKTTSRARGPTAKCLDGALYYSTERRGACATHGGVDKWYGW